METTVRKSISQFKSDIKELAEKQTFYRNQSKTEHIVGERKMPAFEAQYAHYQNGRKLRIMYAAYGLMRGKSFEQTESRYEKVFNKHPLEDYKFEIDKLIEKYSALDNQ